MGLYGIGQSVRREEDPKLLKGQGRYTDDVVLGREARGYVVRSPHAHARVVSIDVRAAKQSPGVIAVLTRDDLKARKLGTLLPVMPRKKHDGSPGFVGPQPMLAMDRVRYVGDPVVFIVAETLNEAKDAAELVEIEYEPLPAVVTAESASAPGAPAIWDENPGNEAFYQEFGDKAAVEAAFARAAHIVRHKVVVNRVTANSMETRGCIGEYIPLEDRYIFRSGTQSVHGTRAMLAQIFRAPQSKFRVICENMGGGFGMKGGVYPEYALCLWASEITGRPVKWIAERGEGIQTDEQGRDSVTDAELALDKDGKFLALRTLMKSAIGAYNTSERNIMPTITAIGCLANTYTFPAVHARVMGVLTNTMMISFYRGGSRPEPVYITEHIIDQAAHELGIDPVELRRRNTIPASAMPYTNALKSTYDCGDFLANLELVAEKADWDKAAARREAARKRGKLLGIGVATEVAPAAGRDFEHAEIRFDPAGGITLISGAMDHGQGHGTTFKQVLSEKLGVDSGQIQYRFGDTDVVTQGIGTFGSRSVVLGGSAVVVAAERIVDKGRKIAAHALEAAEDDIVFERGTFKVVGTDRAISLTDVARRSFQHGALPGGMESGLYARADYGPNDSATWPNGAHICEVEIDADTGKLEMVRYTAVDDVGTMVNPLLCEGQIFGGIVQGAGQAMMEDLFYDRESGQLITGSFTDYCMPRADDFCSFELTSTVVPTKKNPLGAKGAGEAGTCAALPAVVNAVNDALSQIGAPRIEMPATPEKLWRAIQAAKG